VHLVGFVFIVVQDVSRGVKTGTNRRCIWKGEIACRLTNGTAGWGGGVFGETTRRPALSLNSSLLHWILQSNQLNMFYASVDARRPAEEVMCLRIQFAMACNFM
jgi:hypothetical protein